MNKVLLIGSLLFSTSLVAENDLGHQIFAGTNEATLQKKLESKNYSKTVDYAQKTIMNRDKTFKKDDHRYDKRYQDFDYDNEGYYNDDGYYYGYYDTSGYFFNNIFFTYNNHYTYHDRRYRRGYFLPRHHHYRAYHHHRINNWNRIHCYREPNHSVYGDYYDQHYYPPHRSAYHSHYRDRARMSLPNRSSSRQNYNPHRNYNYNQYNNSRSYNNRDYNHRNTARMTVHRNSSVQQRSSSHRSSTGHIQMSK